MLDEVDSPGLARGFCGLAQLYELSKRLRAYPLVLSSIRRCFCPSLSPIADGCSLARLVCPVASEFGYSSRSQKWATPTKRASERAMKKPSLASKEDPTNSRPRCAPTTRTDPGGVNHDDFQRRQTVMSATNFEKRTSHRQTESHF